MKKSKILLSALFWLSGAALAVFIFFMSSRNGSDSADMSKGLMTSLRIPLFGFNHDIFRKLAHFAEFAALGFCLGGAFHFTFANVGIFYSMIPCVLYAISDEIHQYFVPERACRLFDVFVDSTGSLTGILVFLLMLRIISKIKKKNK